MNKEDILLALKDLQQTEESAVSLYSRNISQPPLLNGLEPEDKARVEEILGRMKDDSLRHQKILEELILKVKEGTQDAY